MGHVHIAVLHLIRHVTDALGEAFAVLLERIARNKNVARGRMRCPSIHSARQAVQQWKPVGCCLILCEYVNNTIPAAKELCTTQLDEQSRRTSS